MLLMVGKGNNWIFFKMQRLLFQRAALKNKDYMCLFEEYCIIVIFVMLKLTVLCFSVFLATSVSSSCTDNVCWDDPIQNIRRHERKTGANGDPYELAEQLWLGLQQPVPVFSTFRGPMGPVSFCILYFC